MAIDPRRTAAVARWRLACVVALAGVLLTACGNDEGERPLPRSDAAIQEESLPAPEAGRSGVTGMPALPGPGAIGPPDTLPSDTLPPDTFQHDAAYQAEAAQDPALMPAGPDDFTAAGLPPMPDRPADEPGTREAVALVRQYYAALDDGDFAQAYRLWSDDGAASGRSPQQFADSFAGTASRSVEVLEPGRIEAAAGSRYIEVPVAIEETRRDGSVLRQVGAYTLRRAVADGADARQRAWRISAADLRQVRP